MQNKTTHARILVVEDHPDVLKIFKTMLELHEHEILAAQNGAEAAEVFTSAGKIDLLIADTVMPGPMQGADLAYYLRKLDPQLPVIFVSSNKPEHHAPDAEKRKDDIQLTKPVSGSALLQAVQDALADRAVY